MTIESDYIKACIGAQGYSPAYKSDHIGMITEPDPTSYELERMHLRDLGRLLPCGLDRADYKRCAHTDDCANGAHCPIAIDRSLSKGKIRNAITTLYKRVK